MALSSEQKINSFSYLLPNEYIYLNSISLKDHFQKFDNHIDQIYNEVIQVFLQYWIVSQDLYSFYLFLLFQLLLHFPKIFYPRFHSFLLKISIIFPIKKRILAIKLSLGQLINTNLILILVICYFYFRFPKYCFLSIQFS